CLVAPTAELLGEIEIVEGRDVTSTVRTRALVVFIEHALEGAMRPLCSELSPEGPCRIRNGVRHPCEALEVTGSVVVVPVHDLSPDTADGESSRPTGDPRVGLDVG